MSELASIMMVTYNRLELTKQTVDNIISVTKHPYNFIIIDNASTDGTVEYLENLKRSSGDFGHMIALDVTYNDENKGIAIGRNQSLKRANELGTTWFSTIDNDVLLFDGWLSDCIEVLRNNKSYGMIGVNFEPTSYPLISKDGITFQDKPRGNLGTACTVFHKSFHKTLGYFNTEYGLYGEEDADMGARARAVGFKLGYLEKHGTHLGEGEFDQGEYREFKTECNKKNLSKFNSNARDYFQKSKSVYISYKD